MEENLHKGHRKRVKHRYITNGNLDSFEDHQVLELLLFYCYAQQDTNEIAHRMIKEFGNLYNLFESHPLEISEKCKVSENVAVLVSLVPHLSKRYFTGRWGKREVMKSSRDVGEYCVGLFTDQKYECFFCLCMDNQRRLIAAEMVHKGTINSSPVYPRLIVECALKHTATSVVLAHNHPGGKLTPSRSDVNITRKLVTALETVDIEVTDHIIVAGDKYFSFTEKRMMGT